MNPGGAGEELEVARYGQAFKDRAVATLLPPESSAVEVVSHDIGVTVEALKRWRSEALSQPTPQHQWTAARFEAVLTTAAMDEASKNAWCREHGVYPQALAAPSEGARLATADQARPTPHQGCWSASCGARTRLWPKQRCCRPCRKKWRRSSAKTRVRPSDRSQRSPVPVPERR